MFTIASGYAYGDMGSPPKIPGGATLVFEIQLFDFAGEDITKDKDKGITKRVKKTGEGFDHPNVSKTKLFLSISSVTFQFLLAGKHVMNVCF